MKPLKMNFVFLNNYLIMMNSIYLYIATYFTNKQKNLISLVGAVILTITFFMRNMQFMIFFRESIDFFAKTGGFIWELVFSVAFIMLFLPIMNKEKNLEDAERSQWNYSLLLPLTVFCVFFGISIFTAGLGRLKLVFIYFFIFLPLFDLSRDSTQYKEVIIRFLKIVVLFGFIYYIGSYFLVPYTGKRYAALSLNPNRLGEIAIGILLAGLSLVYLSKNLFTRIYLSFLLGVSLSFIWVSESRTSMLVVAFIFVSAIFYLVKKITLSQSIKAITIIVTMILAVFIMLSLFNVSKDSFYAQNNISLPDNIYYRTIESISKSEKISIDRFEDNPNSFDVLDRFDFDLQDESLGEVDFDPESNNIKKIQSGKLFRFVDKMTTNRLSIWVNYLMRSGILGRREIEVYVDGIRKPIAHSHSIYVQTIYDGGFIAGIAFFIFSIAGIIVYLECLFIYKKTFYGYFYSISIITYLAHGLFEAGYSPLYHLIAFIPLLSIVPFINRSENTTK